jgi:hypothetical protein
VRGDPQIQVSLTHERLTVYIRLLLPLAAGFKR